MKNCRAITGVKFALLLGLVLSLAVVVLAGVRPVHAQIPSGGNDRIEAARNEGEVVWYTAMNTSDTEEVRKLFQAKHPFLTLTVLRQPGEKVRTRILTEMRANRFLWDVVSFNHLDMDVLKQEGLLAAYVSPEIKTGYPQGAVDPEGRWASIYVRQYVIGFNTKWVAPERAPKDWPDLLASQWVGKFAMDESDVEWYAAMLDYWGQERGRVFMRALKKQNPQLRRGHSLLTKLLVAGDFPLALVHAAEIEKEKQGNAPVEWVKTLDPIITSPSQVAISARAPHPHAARMLVDLLLSKEGQMLMRQRGRVPARTDLAGGPAQGSLKVHYVHPKLAREFSRYETEFREIFAKAR